MKHHQHPDSHFSCCPWPFLLVSPKRDFKVAEEWIQLLDVVLVCPLNVSLNHSRTLLFLFLRAAQNSFCDFLVRSS